MRNWLNDVRSYMDPIKIGAVMRAGGIGRVVHSRSSELRAGDLGSLYCYPSVDFGLKSDGVDSVGLWQFGMAGVLGRTGFQS